MVCWTLLFVHQCGRKGFHIFMWTGLNWRLTSVQCRRCNKNTYLSQQSTSSAARSRRAPSARTASAISPQRFSRDLLTKHQHVALFVVLLLFFQRYSTNHTGELWHNHNNNAPVILNIMHIVLFFRLKHNFHQLGLCFIFYNGWQYFWETQRCWNCISHPDLIISQK